MIKFASNLYQEFEDYIRKLNEFGVGEFEVKQVSQAVIIFFDGIPAAIVHKHCDDQIYFPILRRKYFRAPTNEWRRGVIVMGCLGSPVYMKLREQHGRLYTSFPYRRVSQGNEVVIKITFEIIHVRTENVPFYRIVLPPLDLDTDPEHYLVHISIIPKNSEKIETTLPYQVVAKYGLPFPSHLNGWDSTLPAPHRERGRSTDLGAGEVLAGSSPAAAPCKSAE